MGVCGSRSAPRGQAAGAAAAEARQGPPLTDTAPPPPPAAATTPAAAGHNAPEAGAADGTAPQGEEAHGEAAGATAADGGTLGSQGKTPSRAAAAAAAMAAAGEARTRARASSSSSQGCEQKGNIHSNRNLHDGRRHKYTVAKALGKGAYSRVYLATNEDGHQMAIKVVYKNRLKAFELESLHRETSILASISHPHVIKYVEHFEDSQKLYIVTEYLPGGELFDRIVEREYYNEQDARTVMKTLLETIGHCHARGIVHRDIKPENILLASKDNDAEIKVADFGFAKKVDYNSYNSLQTACGTPGYVAPEILTNDTYDHRVDIWSLGVVAYILLCGYPPFRKADKKALYRQIKSAQYVFDSPWWDPVSEQAKDFVSRMLKGPPAERSSIEDLLKHDFITSRVDRDITSNLVEFKEWNGKRKVVLLRNTFKATVRFRMLGKESSSRRMLQQSIESTDSNGLSVEGTIDEGEEGDSPRQEAAAEAEAEAEAEAAGAAPAAVQDQREREREQEQPVNSAAVVLS